ncbi:glycoside hydrolase domain-containing protein [Actinocrispum wychmicini]|uniref:Uncharacterized protein DUF1906 n=1 Tax=Actinocrispum wychmicini TaxID=1213861 RepID=A0A4R2JUM7_9PSEU|nr:glycoside hydrolase domain-containing protein [Actinocrispum wychmicini]TCO62752.1 uncharacterized protein DUF1906 [Actinocrispum wychmicini]
MSTERPQYPGNDVMSGLIRTTNLIWTEFYLAPAPSLDDDSWMSHLADLRGMGWGIAPLFVGQQHPSIAEASHARTAEQGRQDALLAVRLADQAGFNEADLPGAPVIYLDVEVPGALPRPDRTYVNAWCATVRLDQTVYLPGVRCVDPAAAAQLRTDDADLTCWVSDPTREPNQCEVPDPSHPERKFDTATKAWL